MRKRGDDAFFVLKMLLNMRLFYLGVALDFVTNRLSLL